MKSIKVIASFFLVSLFSLATLAQSPVKGISWNKKVTGTFDIVDVQPNTGEVANLVKRVTIEPSSNYVSNTLHHDQQNDLLFFQVQRFFGGSQNVVQGQQFLVFRASTGEKLKELSLASAMAPFVISERNELGFIGVQRESHGYGNNDDDISFRVFNMNTGKTTVSVELPNLSFAAVAAPFVGDLVSNNGTKSSNRIALSSSCYVQASNEMIFCATDVMGVNRLFRIDLRVGKLISTAALGVDVLDIVYNETYGVRALYVEKAENGSLSLFVGKLDINNAQITEPTLLRSITTSEFPITDGSIKMNGSKIFVTKLNPSGKQEVYALDASNPQTVDIHVISNGTQLFDFEFPYTYTSNQASTLKTLVSMYPNPANSTITVASEEKARVTYITIRNEVGQVIKEVKVESGLIENEIDISSLAVGLYLVEIETDMSTPVLQKLMVR